MSGDEHPHLFKVLDRLHEAATTTHEDALDVFVSINAVDQLLHHRHTRDPAANDQHSPFLQLLIINLLI